MKASKESFVTRRAALAAVAAGLAGAGLPAWAADPAEANYPTRTIRLLTPTAVGSVTDLSSRLLAPHLAELLGQSVVVENVVGAGGVTGTRQLVRSPKDGYTIGMITNNHVINPNIYKDMQFDSLKDVQPIGNVGNTPLLLVTGPTGPIRELKDLLAAARQKPGALTFGSTGNGTVGHLAGVMLTTDAKIEMKHVPYKSAGQQFNDLMGGQIDMLFTGLATGAPQVEGGKLRALAVTSPTRSALLPNVPTLQELDLTNSNFAGWVLLVAPAGVPRPIIDKLNAALRTALARPDVQQTLTKAAVTITPSNPDQATRFLEAEMVRHAYLAKRGGAVLE
ncbi:Bug family tripartite tricarboxylate transporter substrate binding protein [Ramlibacter sp.]|uniref:Bug family tripartite tricarboxylate transporter substrate binding protein n=1 Tax=Ramlibacter sp. TaxID=1917967 RepID=UPI003D106D93